MAIRNILGMEHLPVGVNNPTAFLGDLPLSFFVASGSRPAQFFSGGWVGSPTSGYTTGVYARYHLWSLSDKATSKSFMGFRVKYVGNGTFATNEALCWVLPSNGTFAGTYTPLIWSTDLPSGSGANNDGKEYYIEFGFNHTTGVVERWVDGVKIANVTPVAAIVTAIKAWNHAVVLSLGEQSNLAFHHRDLYYLEVTADGSVSDRLGPQRVERVPIDEAVGTNWVPTSTMLADLTTPLSTTNQNTPVVTSPTPITPLKLGLAPSSLLSGRKISAVQGVVSAQRQVSSLTNLQSKLEMSAMESVGLTKALTDAMIQNINTGLFHKAPDGADWDYNKLNQTSLVLLPS